MFTLSVKTFCLQHHIYQRCLTHFIHVPPEFQLTYLEFLETSKVLKFERKCSWVFTEFLKMELSASEADTVS